MVTTMTMLATRLPAIAGTAHRTDPRACVLAPITSAPANAARGITVPASDVRIWGGVGFAPVYRTADVHRSVAGRPPV
jgi:hypothetical protein